MFENAYILIGLIAILVSIIVLSITRRVLLSNTKNLEGEALYDALENALLLKQVRVVLIVITTLFFGGMLIYNIIDGSPYQGHFMEWLNLIVRWAHVVAGVMWIGASFYFVFLENNLNRTLNVRDELAGNLWAIHGGGFYFLEKYKVAPKEIPEDLHWFKYEAYFTWMTGFSLLCVVYYMDARAFMIDPTVADISEFTAISIGVGTLLFGWIVYDFMCKSPLIKNQKLFALVGLIILTGVSYFLTQYLSARAAYIHVGGLIGTIMALNVYFTIIPGQKAMVRAAKLGLPLDATLGKKALQRSLHNNYLTLPVIFIMISNHFPSTFGNEYNWLVLIGITIASAGIKHYWNLVEQGKVNKIILPVSIAALLGLAIVTSPKIEKLDKSLAKIEYTEIQTIMNNRCTQCHSSAPTDDKWTTAPNGVMFDNAETVKNMSEKIMLRAVQTKTMPQGNKTGMLDEEREVLKNWILQGANIDE